MSKKTLKINNFGECILNEFNLFAFRIKQIHQTYPKESEKNPDVYTVEFTWSWNGYEGYGEIQYFKSTSTLCNEFGENFSNMTVSSKSKRQQPNGRSNCALYNDKSLIKLFEFILSNSDLSIVKSYDEWINSM